MGEILKELQAEIGSGGMKGQSMTPITIGLVPDRLAGRQKDGSRIGKAADTIQRAEVMIEGAVLLHQDDDVFDVEDAARVSVGNDR